METFQLLVGYAIPLTFFVFLILVVIWTWTDAEKRGKSPLLVSVFVLLSFPAGQLAWLIFRPTETPSKPFNLMNYRS